MQRVGDAVKKQEYFVEGQSDKVQNLDTEVDSRSPNSRRPWTMYKKQYAVRYSFLKTSIPGWRRLIVGQIAQPGDGNRKLLPERQAERLRATHSWLITL